MRDPDLGICCCCCFGNGKYFQPPTDCVRVCVQPNSLHIVTNGSYKQVSQRLFPLSF